jgi:hypothetical protein
VLFISESNPIATFLSLLVSFFVPFVSRKEFLALSIFYFAAITGMVFVRRDTITPILFGIDIFTALGVAALVIPTLILKVQPAMFLKAMHPAIIQSAGILVFFLSELFSYILGSIDCWLFSTSYSCIIKSAWFLKDGISGGVSLDCKSAKDG